MTPNVKRYLALDKQISANEKKAKKFESGFHYDSTRRDIWQAKANLALKKQMELNLTDEENEQINAYYGCYEN